MTRGQPPDVGRVEPVVTLLQLLAVLAFLGAVAGAFSIFSSDSAEQTAGIATLVGGLAAGGLLWAAGLALQMLAGILWNTAEAVVGDDDGDEL